MTASLLAARDLGHAFGDVVALHSVNFDVPSGTGLVGANGQGRPR
jgi:ABC-type branched-subunit amino acid transport system ATPase component